MLSILLRHSNVILNDKTKDPHYSEIGIILTYYSLIRQLLNCQTHLFYWAFLILAINFLSAGGKIMVTPPTIHNPRRRKFMRTKYYQMTLKDTYPTENLLHSYRFSAHYPFNSL